MDFCIASPHKNILWYDYRVYCNLREALESFGYRYKAASQNRIYFLGGPQREFYPEVGRFDENANNIALIYCHAEKLSQISHFNKVLVSSDFVKEYLTEKCSASDIHGAGDGKINPFQTADEIEVLKPFSSLKKSEISPPRYRCDLAFMGTPRIRPIVESVLDIADRHGLNMRIIGPNWDKYEGHPKAKDYWLKPSIPYDEISMLAKGAKIVLTDHHDMMNELGTVSHKYIDLLNAGAFIISDRNKDAEQHYKGITYHDKPSLEQHILRYLNDEEARMAHIKAQQNIAKYQTSVHAAHSLARFFI